MTYEKPTAFRQIQTPASSDAYRGSLLSLMRDVMHYFTREHTTQCGILGLCLFGMARCMDVLLDGRFPLSADLTSHHAKVRHALCA